MIENKGKNAFMCHTIKKRDFSTQETGPRVNRVKTPDRWPGKGLDTMGWIWAGK